MDKNEVKKDLYKTKAMAKFSHYVSGNLYYKVELSDGIYQFPVSTIEIVSLGETVFTGVFYHDGNENEYYEFKKTLMTYTGNKDYNNSGYEELKFAKLSSDLGTTTFSNEIRDSELSRWISKAIDSGDFVKVS